MRFRALPIAIVALACVSCGGEETGMGIVISRSVSAIAPDVVRVRLQVHVKERSCDDVRNSGPDKRATHVADFSASGGGAGEGEIHEIRPGTYTVAVWTFDAAMTAREFGCEPRVVIEEGTMTEVPITVAPL